MGATGRARAAGLLVAAALGMTACWPQQGATSGGQNYNALENTLTTENVATLAPAWSTPGVITSVWGDTAYGVADAELTAYDVATGGVDWSAQIPSVSGQVRPLPGPAVSGPDLVLAYDETFLAPPGGQETQAFAGLRWDLATGAPTGILSDPHAPGIITDRTLNVVPGPGVVAYERESPSGPGNAELHVVSTDVEPVPGGSGLTRNIRLWSGVGGHTTVPPIFAGDAIIDVDQWMLRSFPATGCGAPTCEPTWEVELGTITSVAAGPGNLIFVTQPASGSVNYGAIRAIDRRTGATVWQTTPLHEAPPLAVVGDVVYLDTALGIYAFPAQGCGGNACPPIWTGLINGRSRGNLAAAGGVLYVGTETGVVHAFDLAGCGGPTRCSPLATLTVDRAPDRLVVAGGHLFVGLPATAEADATTVVFAPTG